MPRDYWTCPCCGENLDFGERHACEKNEAVTAGTVTTSAAERSQFLTADFSISRRLCAVKGGSKENV